MGYCSRHGTWVRWWWRQGGGAGSSPGLHTSWRATSFLVAGFITLLQASIHVNELQRQGFLPRCRQFGTLVDQFWFRLKIFINEQRSKRTSGRLAMAADAGREWAGEGTMEVVDIALRLLTWSSWRISGWMVLWEKSTRNGDQFLNLRVGVIRIRPT
jgi:hypothetical protein